MRVELSNELTELINELGPQVWDDFDHVSPGFFPRKFRINGHLAQFRILVPSASAPPSSGTPGIWRRKSGVGGVDAQGGLLAHPMVRDC